MVRHRSRKRHRSTDGRTVDSCEVSSGGASGPVRIDLGIDMVDNLAVVDRLDWKGGLESAAEEGG